MFTEYPVGSAGRWIHVNISAHFQDQEQKLPFSFRGEQILCDCVEQKNLVAELNLAHNTINVIEEPPSCI